MSSSETKTIAVVGATGNQGSSVAKTFLATPGWKVRCLTRSPGSEKAKALESQGAQVVQADMNDVSSLEAAFDGVQAIFLNTDFWATYRLGGTRAGDSQLAFDDEFSHGRNAADVASRVPTLERLVYSALGPMKRTSGGRYPHGFHWDTKATIVDYIFTEHAEGLAKKASVIYPGAYTTNPLLMPKKHPITGEYMMMIAATASIKMPIIDPTSSMGPLTLALVEDEAPGTKLLAYDTDSYLTIKEAVDVWQNITGQECKIVEVDMETMSKTTGLPYEVLEVFPYLAEYGYMGGIDEYIEPGHLTKQIKTPSFAEWLKSQPMEYLLSSEVPNLS